MKNNSFLTLGMLVKRNVKLFLKDKMTVFFSLLAPIIILMLYILFLANIQTDSINAFIPEGIDVDDKLIRGFVDNWMVAGVMGVSCITVAFSANTIMVRDRERGMVNDILSAPVKKWVIYASYIISCFVITFVICMFVFFAALIYLACTGGIYMSFLDFLAIFGITIMSIISSSVITVLIASFVKTEAALGSIIGIFSAAVGFLTGAYMPLGMFPDAIQYAVCFIPGTYSAGLFRNYLLRGPLEALLDGGVPVQVIDQLKNTYSADLKLFGTTISEPFMFLALALSIVLFGAALLIIYSKKKNILILKNKKEKQKKS